MNFSALEKVVGLIDTSTRIRWTVWAGIAAAWAYVLLFGSAALVTAIRWW